MASFKIGAISFLNTKPLIRGLETGECGEHRLVYGSPSALADKLRHGELDAALIPSVELFRGVGEEIVPGLCIASEGPVDSIRLLSKKPLSELDTVYVDRGSRSSVAMLRLLLERSYRVTPDFHIYEPNPEDPLRGPTGDSVEAGLLIGDTAMKAEAGELPFDVDLGDWWQKTFHQPFVYAVWALRAGNPELQEILQDSFLAGQASMDRICEEAALSMGLPLQEVMNYLSDRIHFELDLPRLEGLRLFHRLCQEDHLAPLRASVTAMLDKLGAAPRVVAAPAL